MHIIKKIINPKRYNSHLNIDVSVCIIHGHVCASLCMCTGVRGQHWVSFFNCFSNLFFEAKSLTEVKLVNSISLAGQ